MSHIREHDLGGGYTVIIEWSPTWKSYVGTVHHDGRSVAGTILRDTPEQIMDRAVEVTTR